MIFWQILCVMGVLFLASIAGSLITLGKTLIKCEKTMSALFGFLVLYVPTKKKDGEYASRSTY